MHQTVLPRPILSSARWFSTALLLLVALFLSGGVRVAMAAPEARTPFPRSLKPMSQVQQAVSLTGASVDQAGTVDFQVTLRMRDFAKLQTRVSKGERISESELRERYFPTKADYQTVVAWAKAQGLTVVNENDATHLGVRVRGPVATVEHALGTQYAQVAVDGRNYLAAQTMPSLPARVAAPVLGITGLQPYLKVRQHSTTVVGATPYIPSDILLAYRGNNLTTVTGAPLDGTDQTIAIIADRAPVDVDVTAFWTNAKVPGHVGAAYNAYVTNVNLTGNDMLEAPVNSESTLDVSWATGIASGAQVRLYIAGSTDLSDIDKALQQIVSDTQPDRQPALKITQLSISFSLEQGEAELADDEITMQSQYYATLAARGVSIFVASGDKGSTPVDPNQYEVEYPASDPSVTAVGGTSLVINRNTNSIASELAWDTKPMASGGGESNVFPAPAYQTGNGIQVSGRGVPDVSSAADPNNGAYLVFTKADSSGKLVQTEITTGGTSWSAPTWAAFGAMINQAREAAGLPDAGLLNPSLYGLYGTTAFRDITNRGANANAANYPPGPGYDLITGLGSPVLSRIITALTNGGDLTINSFSPDSGAPGTDVTINGTQLDKVVTVRFNGTTATRFEVVNGTQLVATVPDGASTGPITVVARDGTTATSPVSFTVLPVGAAQNDFFADAQLIGPAQTSLTGSNVGATKEDGEPDHAGNPGGASVWYKWTPPSDGTYTFNTFGSSFDTLLAVYVGDSVDSLTEIVSNDDLSTGVTSSVVFAATYGATYYIAVDGAQQTSGGQPAEGTIVLNLSASSDAPVINDFDPPRGTVGQTVKIFGANFLSVTRVQFNGTSATFRTDSATQISAIVPQGATTGSITVTDNTGRDSTSARRFTVVPIPANDAFANAQQITGTQAALSGSNVGASKEAGEPNHAGNTGGASVWFVWTAPNTGVFSFDTFGSDFDTLLAVYTGGTVQTLVSVAQNDDAGALGTSAVTFNAKGGTVYHIAVDGYSGAQGNYRLNLSATSGKPVITSFTPTSGGAGTNVVLTGSGFQTVTSVKFNGVEAAGFVINSDSQITVSVPNGATTGPIAATGLNGTAVTTSNFTVLPLPPNDYFRNSQLLVGGTPIVVTGSNAGATKEAGEPTIIPGDNGGRSIWYSWAPPASGDYVITTRGSDFDTLLGVYTGSTVSTLTPVATNDDDPEGGVTSSVTLTATRDTVYRIVVDGSNGEAGNVTLSILGTSAVQALYTTNFEPSEGFDSKRPLVGQQGWLAVNQETGGNGIGVNQIPNLGQQGLVGQTPPNDGAAAIKVYHPFSYQFGQGDFPIVYFSTVLRLAGSTNGQDDRFGFTFNNALDASAGADEGGKYFSIIFDNATLQVYYQYPDGPLVPTGVSFTHDAVYSLQASLDFQSGRWSATLNGTTLATGLPFASSGTLTRISADWVLKNPALPGNNYMVFDQYAVNAPSKATPVITLQPATQTILTGQSVTFAVAATGTPPLQYQWYFEGVPIAGATNSTYTIPVVNPSNAGRYSVIVSNGFGSTRSLDAFLIVSTPLADIKSIVEASVVVSPINESGSVPATILLTRTGDLSGALVVEYAVHGTAQPGIDYQALDGRATFKPGRAKKRIKIIPIERGIRDGSEVKVVVKILDGNGYSAGPSSKVKVFIERQ